MHFLARVWGALAAPRAHGMGEGPRPPLLRGGQRLQRGPGGLGSGLQGGGGQGLEPEGCSGVRA
eukprot:6227715-Lingulodinium_polyedra.AAC.1